LLFAALPPDSIQPARAPNLVFIRRLLIMQIWTTLILAVQLIAALVMIGLVLLQQGKGADMGASFGSGASGSLFGATGSANFLSRSTAATAAVFFLCTLALTYIGSDSQRSSSNNVLDRPTAASAAASAAGAIPGSLPAVKPVAPAASAAVSTVGSTAAAAASSAAGAIPAALPAVATGAAAVTTGAAASAVSK
jgi:preprotein translocase subunit SecG